MAGDDVIDGRGPYQHLHLRASSNCRVVACRAKLWYTLSMQIKNYTTFDTRKLKTLILTTYNAEAQKRGDLSMWSRTRVEVVDSRTLYTGRAATSGLWMVLRIPSADKVVDVPELVALTRHEIWHLYGILHHDFPENVMYCRRDTPFVRGVVARLGPDFSITRKVKVEAKPSKTDVLEKKLASIAVRLKTWESKHKRAETAIAKLVKEQKTVTKKIVTLTIA